MRYLTGTLNVDVEQAIKAEAEKGAEEAISYGGRSPWGDGETLPSVRDLLHALPRDIASALKESAEQSAEAASCYDYFFRAHFDANAPSAE